MPILMMTSYQMWMWRKKWNILNFATIVNKSCKCDLYHLGEPYNLDGKCTLVEKMVFMIGLLDCVV
jgi:hypothetical protein